ncbi:hypothetical protein WMF11_13245 [Sorangium sp. So ce295]|uniref:hypothetical protein n=1 Tax=Sorangium sp. So ce295 TaxID=3133295 RepID=UPI003F619426
MRSPRLHPASAGLRRWLPRALAGACCAWAMGCAERAPSSTSPAPRVASTARAAAPAPAASAASAPPAGTPPASPPTAGAPSGDAPARERWVGTLELTKGSQPLIAGRMLSSEDAERWLGPEWRALAGQRVRVLAVLRDHVCEPHAQCMIGGIIPLLEQVASVELCSSTGSSGSAAVVDCAPSPAQKERCQDECRTLSEDCGRRADGDRGGLRRCGCAKVTCENGCEETGEPAFTCR